MHGPNFYEVLGICTDAPPAEVRAAYRRTVLRTHPDKGGSAEDFRLATHAFEVLSCAASRKMCNSSKVNLSRQDACPATTVRSAATTTSAHSRCKQKTSFPRQRVQMKKEQQKKKKKQTKFLNTTVTAMHRLKVILQAMDAKSRHEVFTNMSEVMRKALERFMTDSSCRVSQHVPTAIAVRTWPARHKPQANATSIRTCNRAHRTKYQAQMHVKALRLYTRPQDSLESATQHQIQLSLLRHVMAAEEKTDPDVWLDATKIYQMCKSFFKEMAMSETDLGLRAFVHIRAQSWLGQSIQITSVSTTLCAALDAHARLLKARATSWDLFRAEWIQLMLDKGRVTLTEAEAVADGARQTELQQQVAKALRGAAQALDKEQRRVSKRTTLCARTQAVDAEGFVEEGMLRPKQSRMSNVAFMGG